MAKSKKNQDQDPIKNASPASTEEAYVFWGDSPESMKNAQAESAKSLEEFTGVQRSEASRRYGFNYSNLDISLVEYKSDLWILSQLHKAVKIATGLLKVAVHSTTGNNCSHLHAQH